MLSYRHAFHAGNHADVLKHFLLVQMMRHLCRKEAPFWVIDTHAGAGLYALDAGYATQLAEHADGIGRLWPRDDLPAALADYVGLVRGLNPDGVLRAYPGSPWIAFQLLRPQDRLRLFELHPGDSPLLQQNFRAAGKRVVVALADGFAGLKALLPPPSRRALVLIDPAYEVKDDYRQVPETLDDGLKRFATGSFALWYPQLQSFKSRQLPERLKARMQSSAGSWLHVSLTVSSPAADGFGMHGSGMFLINPPWTLRDSLLEVMPYLVKTLGQDGGAAYALEQGGS